MTDLLTYQARRWYRRLEHTLGVGEVVVDIFAGGGGASTGIEFALGRPVNVAINHDPKAIEIHKANHPDTFHFRCDVREVDPRQVLPGRSIGLLWASPDCFPSGTMVLAQDGYRRIDDVRVGEYVFTHKLRWRKVTSSMKSVRPLVEVRGQGHPGLVVSQEHPFYVRHKRSSETAQWTPAKNLDKGTYWASPGKFPEIDIPGIPVHQKRTLAVTEKLLWLAGLYVADGWTRLTATRAELVITCGNHEIDRRRAELNRWPRKGNRSSSEELGWTERSTSTAYQFSTNHRGLVEWLRQNFGHGASKKLIPGWVLGMRKEFRQAFLDGYLAGDGCLPKCSGSQVVICTTVSKSLAFGLKALATSFGFSASVYRRDNQPDVIQGRKVKVLPAWSVRWRPERKRFQSFYDKDMDWAPVREVRDLGITSEVFNLSVEEDESYIAEGIVVHNCTHHSRAKGGKPVKRGRRALANVVVVWAAARRPRVIMLENVGEFLDWGPLDDLDKPDKARKGQSFNRWKNKLTRLGYHVEHRILVAADYGVPTIRKRLFLIARLDGKAIVWPDRTHAPRDKAEALGLAPWRSAAECIDWTIPCKSIFSRKKELALNTLSRIANGLRRYVMESDDPYIVETGSNGVPSAPFVSQMSHGGTNHSPKEPLKTITATPDGGDMQVIQPMLLRTDMHSSNSKCVYDPHDPLRTITTTGGHAVVQPYLAQINHSGKSSRGRNIKDPMRTLTASRDHHGLVLPFLSPYHKAKTPGEVRGSDVRNPTPTLDTQNRHAVVQVKAFLTKHKKKSTARDLKEPLATQTTKSSDGLATVFLNKHYTGVVGQSVETPLGTVTSQDHHSLTMAWLEKFYGTAKSGKDMREPMPTVTGGGYHIGKVSAFLVKYFGTANGQDVKNPMSTVTGKARLGLVTIAGIDFQIVDIGLRMLVPMELLRAQFGKFADGYKLIGNIADRISAIGNSVPPEISEKLVKANY